MKSPFGEGALQIVQDILKYKKSGRVLDLGAGYGRNALFLAKQGFEVTAVDRSKIGLSRLATEAEKENLKINIFEEDIAKFNFKENYDVILVNFVLHDLEKQRALELLSKIKAATAPQGLNCLTVFTNDGDFYRANPKTENFYPNPGELKEFYADWRVLDWKEEIRRAYEKRANGERMRNLVSYLLVQKPG